MLIIYVWRMLCRGRQKQTPLVDAGIVQARGGHLVEKAEVKGLGMFPSCLSHKCAGLTAKPNELP